MNQLPAHQANLSTYLPIYQSYHPIILSTCTAVVKTYGFTIFICIPIQTIPSLQPYLYPHHIHRMGHRAAVTARGVATTSSHVKALSESLVLGSGDTEQGVGRTVPRAPKKAGGTMKLEIYPWIIDGSLKYNNSVSVCLTACLPGHLYVCMSVRCLFVCISVCMSVWVVYIDYLRSMASM